MSNIIMPDRVGKFEQETIEQQVAERLPALPKGINPKFPLYQQHLTGSTAVLQQQRVGKPSMWAKCPTTGLPEAMFIEGGDNGSPALWHTVAVSQKQIPGGEIIVDYVILLCPSCGNTLKVDANSEREIRVHFNQASLSPIDNLWRPSISIGPWGCSYHLDGREGVTGPCGAAYGVINGRLHKARRRRGE